MLVNSFSKATPGNIRKVWMYSATIKSGIGKASLLIQKSVWKGFMRSI